MRNWEKQTHGLMANSYKSSTWTILLLSAQSKPGWLSAKKDCSSKDPSTPRSRESDERSINSSILRKELPRRGWVPLLLHKFKSNSEDTTRKTTGRTVMMNHLAKISKKRLKSLTSWKARRCQGGTSIPYSTSQWRQVWCMIAREHIHRINKLEDRKLERLSFPKASLNSILAKCFKI